MARRIPLAVLALFALGALTACVPNLEAVETAPPAATAVPGIPSDAFEMTVESITDGDTLRAVVASPNAVVTDTASTRVRLLGIDTPEVRPAVECWGDEATATLAALAPPGSRIWAAADPEPHDQYGRTLLYLWTADGAFINAALVSQGAARVEVYSPNDTHEQLLRDLEAEAVAAGVGRWSACG